MKEIDLLLTDEFVQFSKDITVVHEEKKKLKDEFKKLYDKFQADVAALDAKAQEASQKWDAWKAGHEKKPEGTGSTGKK